VDIWAGNAGPQIAWTETLRTKRLGRKSNSPTPDHEGLNDNPDDDIVLPPRYY
jgi:hypothetical protein